MTQTMRERLARIVDPEAFRGFDRLMREAAALRYDDGEAMTERQAANIREDAPGCTRKAYLIVDAILAELRTPGGAMVTAALDRYQGPDESLHASVFTAMIDAVREGK